MDSDSIYTDKFLDHFINPRNVGEIENPDGYAKVGDPQCGDYIKVWLKIEDDTITDYKYKVFGCGGAIATTSVVSELAIGRRLRDAIDLTDDIVIQALGGIPENKAHCSLLGIQGLRTALADYFIKQNHLRYEERLDLYRRYGYNITMARDRLVKKFTASPDSAKMLDIGTGKGHLALALARAGFRCVSVDVSKDELHYASLNALYFQLDHLIDFQNHDAARLSFEPHSFDGIASADLIHHLPDPQPVLTEMLRVCKPTGRIIITDFSQKGFEIMNEAHLSEGRIHPVTGWKIEKVAQWFADKNCHVQSVEEVCEIVLIIEPILST